MSYRCQVCNMPQKPRAKPTFVITAKRPKVYPIRYGIVEGKMKEIDKGGEGWEIAQEKAVCGVCLKKMTPVMPPRVAIA